MAYITAPKADFNAALPYLQQAQTFDKTSKDPLIYLVFGDYWAYQGKQKEGLAEYNRALALDPSMLRSRVQIGRMYMAAGEFSKADSALKAVIASEPNYGPAYRLLAETYEKQYLANKSDRLLAAASAENYRRYLQHTGGSFQTRLNYAMLLYTLGDFKELEKEVTSIWSLAPDTQKRLVVTRLRGYAAYENGNYPAALQDLNTLLTSTDNKGNITAEDYLYTSLTQQKLKLQAAALENAVKAVKLDSSKSSALEALAKNHYNEQNWQKAVETYTILKSLKGNAVSLGAVDLYNGTALFFQYVEAFNRGERPPLNLLLQANSLFEQVLKHSSSLFEAHLWNARTLYLLEDQQESQGKMVLAYEAYINAVELSTRAQTAATKRNLIEAFNAIAGFAASSNDKVKAGLYWNKSLKLDPENAIAIAGMKALMPARRAGRR